jgi:hypothetical protein
MARVDAEYQPGTTKLQGTLGRITHSRDDLPMLADA